LASAKGVKMIASILNVLQGWDRTPRTTFVINEVYVCIWNSTPLLGGSVRQSQTFSSLLFSKARGVLHRKARPYCIAKEAS
jgi:hypothetical protein